MCILAVGYIQWTCM